MKWQCALCDATERGTKPSLCSQCGAVDSFLPLALAPSAFVRASDVRPSNVKPLPTGDKELDAILAGGFPPKTRVLLWGKGGSGKSRCALRWATRLGKALAVSLEMDEELCARTAREAGARIGNLLITRDEQAQIPTRGVAAVVLDSISECSNQEEVCERLSAWAQQTGGVVFMVCHATKSGQYRGPSTLQHWGDVEMQVSASRRQPGSARVRVNKSRICPLGSAVVPLVALHSV